MRTPYDNDGIAVILALSRGFGKRNFLQSLLSKWFRDTPNDFVSPVGETSWSRFYRSAGALGCHTRIREGFPRDGSRTVFFIVARGPVPRDRHHHDVCIPICSL